MKKLLETFKNSKKWQIGLFALVFAAIGAILLLISHAAPAVTIYILPNTSPVKGQVYVSAATSFDSTSKVRGVSSVDYYLDNTLIKTQAATIFGAGITWDTTARNTDGSAKYADGAHTLKATVHNVGNTQTATGTLAITIQNSVAANSNCPDVPVGIACPASTGLNAANLKESDLTPYTGPSAITVDNTVIDKKLITKGICVQAKNVKITNSKIVTSGDPCGVQGAIHFNDTATGGLVQNVEITSTDVNSATGILDRAILCGEGGTTIKNVYIHDLIRGINMGSGCTIDHSYIDTGKINPTQNHTSGLGSNGGLTNVNITNSFIRTSNPYASSAVSVYTDCSTGQPAGGCPNNHVVIDNCLMNTNAYWVMYLDDAKGSYMQVKNSYVGVLDQPEGGAAGIGPVGFSNTQTGDLWNNNKWWVLGNEYLSYPAGIARTTHKNGEIIPW